MLNRLHALYAANRGKGRPLAFTVAGSEATIDVYDMIVANQAEADWMGGIAADTFVRQLRALDVATVHLRINCPGGDVFAGVAMAQAIRECSARVIAHIDGYAASAASLLLCAADEAVIAPGGMVMVHQAWTMAFGNAEDLIATARLLGKIDGDLAAAYADKTGTKAADWVAPMAAETWYTAAEAVAAGLCDALAEAPKKAAAATARFDLGVYARAPQAAPVPDKDDDDDLDEDGNPLDPEEEELDENGDPIDKPRRQSKPKMDDDPDASAQSERRARLLAARLLLTAA